MKDNSLHLAKKEPILADKPHFFAYFCRISPSLLLQQQLQRPRSRRPWDCCPKETSVCFCSQHLSRALICVHCTYNPTLILLPSTNDNSSSLSVFHLRSSNDSKMKRVLIVGLIAQKIRGYHFAISCHHVLYRQASSHRCHHIPKQHSLPNPQLWRRINLPLSETQRIDSCIPFQLS